MVGFVEEKVISDLQGFLEKGALLALEGTKLKALLA